VTAVPGPSVWQRSKPALSPTVRHVIERYEHRAQLVTCTCGWKGASTDDKVTDWKAHLAEMRLLASAESGR
jgi:hypothetical protein